MGKEAEHRYRLTNRTVSYVNKSGWKRLFGTKLDEQVKRFTLGDYITKRKYR